MPGFAYPLLLSTVWHAPCFIQKYSSPKHFQIEGTEMRITTLASALLTVLVGTTLSAAQAAQIAPRAAQGARYGQLPLTFEANQGQAAGQVKFLSHGKGYNALLTTGGMTLTLRPSLVVTNSKVASHNASASEQSTRRYSFNCRARARTPRSSARISSPAALTTFSGMIPASGTLSLPTYAHRSLQGRISRNRSDLLRQPSATGV